MKPSAKVGAVAVPVALAAAVAMPAAAWADEQPAPEPSEPQAALSEPQADLGSPGAGQQSGAGPEAPSAPAADSAKAPSTALGSPSQAAPGAQGGSAPADPDPSAPGTAEGGAAAGDGADALEPASASPAPAAAKRGWDVASDGSVRYYGDDGSLHTGWLVDDSYMDYGLQRYWFGVDGVMARSRLVDAADAGWWAYATARGYVVRGRYVDPSTGYVYLADNDGRLASPGWVVSDAYGQGLQRYWVDAGAHACVPGYSPDGWDHWTTSEGYVLRGAHREGDLVYLADNDGRLASPGWVVSDAYGQGLQRYWVDAGRHAAVVGYFQVGEKWYYGTSNGYVLRGKSRVGAGMLIADNDGLLIENYYGEGWVVTDQFDGEMQRYRIDYSCDGHLGAHLGLFSLGDKQYYGRYDYGYVVRNVVYTAPDGSKYYGDNDGVLGALPCLYSDMYSHAQGYSSSTSTLILVDTVGNRIAIYSGHQGAWSPLIEARCVSGAPATPTIKGSYSTTGFTRTSLDTDSRARWCTQISGGYFFHTILASESELGNNLSHGCIRLSVGNAQWIYNNVHKGTRVIIW